MIIQPSNASQIYKSYAATPKNSESKVIDKRLSSNNNVDRLELSNDILHSTQPQSLASTISREVSEDTAPERLSLLKDKIANNTYNVSSGSIASSMMSGGIIAKE